MSRATDDGRGGRQLWPSSTCRLTTLAVVASVTCNKPIGIELLTSLNVIGITPISITILAQIEQ